jgi:hypothetical protein
MCIVKIGSKKTTFHCNSFGIGTLLKDGYLNKYGGLTVEHSLKQEKYVWWK